MALAVLLAQMLLLLPLPTVLEVVVTGVSEAAMVVVELALLAVFLAQ